MKKKKSYLETFNEMLGNLYDASETLAIQDKMTFHQLQTVFDDFNRFDDLFAKSIGTAKYVSRQKILESLFSSLSQYYQYLKKNWSSKSLQKFANIDQILETNKSEISNITNNLSDLDLCIVPVIPMNSIHKMIEKTGKCFDWLNLTSRFDVESCIGIMQRLMKHLQDEITSMPDDENEYVLMFRESKEDDLKYKKRMCDLGFIEMDFYNAVLIFFTTKLYLSDIHFYSGRYNKSTYCMLDWISGKHSDENYDNPTVKIFYDIPPKKRVTKFFKIFKKQ